MYSDPVNLIACGVMLFAVSFLIRVWRWSQFARSIRPATGPIQVSFSDRERRYADQNLEILYEAMVVAGSRWHQAMNTETDAEIAVLAQQYMRATVLFRTAMESNAARNAPGLISDAAVLVP